MLLDHHGDLEAMHRRPGERLEHEHVERAADDVEIVWHRCSLQILYSVSAISGRHPDASTRFVTRWRGSTRLRDETVCDVRVSSDRLVSIHPLRSRLMNRTIS